MEVIIDPSKSVFENAARYYELSKKYRKKAERLKEYLQKKKKDQCRSAQVRKKEWYERFYWFVTSGGFLAIGGRDAKTNQIVVRRYMEPKDLYFHADIHGASSVILKRGQEAKEADIYETCVFAACYSSAWKYGLLVCDVFYVKPEQVSLSAPSGEYLPKGGFLITGEKNIVKHVELKLEVSYDEEKEKLIVGVNLRGKKITIRPYNEKKEESVKKLYSKLKELYPDIVISLPELSSRLPPGGFKIVE